MDNQLLDILACPLCKSSLIDHEVYLVCRPCKQRWPIVDGIPNLLMDAAMDLEPTSDDSVA